MNIRAGGFQYRDDPEEDSAAEAENAAVRKVAKRGGKTGKTYEFNEDYPKQIPAQMWFQESLDGLVLFIVFYTQACRWSRCLGCNLPSLCSQFHVGWEDLMEQVDWVFSNEEVVEKKSQIRKVIVSNNGSVLDEETFSTTALFYLGVMCNKHLPNLSVLTLESRPEYVDEIELELLSRLLEEAKIPTQLEIAVGFEAFDNRIRNMVFKKGLSLKVFEEFIKLVARHKFRVKCYLMQKPVPEMSDQEAIKDIQKAIDYLSILSGKYGVEINVHLNPTYAAKGTLLGESFKKGEYIPPYLRDVAKAAYYAKDNSISVYIGLYDEGLAVEGGSFIRKGDERIVYLLEQFNTTQDYGILEQIR